MLRCSLGQPGRSVCVWVSGMRVCTVRYAAAPQAKTVGITSTPPLSSPPPPASAGAASANSPDSNIYSLYLQKKLY